MKAIVLLTVLTLSACAGLNEPLAMVKDDAPVAQLNPDRWNATVNDLILPPSDGPPHPSAAPVSTIDRTPRP